MELNYPRAYFFQMTIAKSHPVRALHLYNLWVALPSSVRRVPPALVGVVPKSREGEYTKPQPIDDRSSNKIPRGLNPKNWPQYRIGIDSMGFLGNKALGRRVVSDTCPPLRGSVENEWLDIDCLGGDFFLFSFSPSHLYFP